MTGHHGAVGVQLFPGDSPVDAKSAFSHDVGDSRKGVSHDRAIAAPERLAQAHGMNAGCLIGALGVLAVSDDGVSVHVLIGIGVRAKLRVAAGDDPAARLVVHGAGDDCGRPRSVRRADDGRRERLPLASG